MQLPNEERKNFLKDPSQSEAFHTGVNDTNYSSLKYDAINITGRNEDIKDACHEIGNIQSACQAVYTINNTNSLHQAALTMKNSSNVNNTPALCFNARSLPHKADVTAATKTDARVLSSFSTAQNILQKLDSLRLELQSYSWKGRILEYYNALSQELQLTTNVRYCKFILSSLH